MNIDDIKNNLAKWQKSLLLSGEHRLLKDLVIPKSICDFYGIKTDSRLLVAYMGHKKFDDTYFYLLLLENQGCILFENGYDPNEINWGAENYDTIIMKDGLVSVVKMVKQAVEFRVTWENGHPQAKNSKGDILEFANLPDQELLEEVPEEPKDGFLFLDLKMAIFNKENIIIISEEDMEAAIAFLHDDGHVSYFGEYTGVTGKKSRKSSLDAETT